MEHKISKYLSFSEVCFVNRELLLAALAELGYTGDRVQVHDKPVNLYGYSGDKRQETAEIVIPRHRTGISSSNDIGFTKTDKGYIPIISEYDESQLRVKGDKFVVALRKAYGEKVVEKLAKKHRSSVKREQVGNTVKLRVRVG